MSETRTRTSFEIVREAVHLSYRETTALRDVYGFASSSGIVALDGYRLTPKGRPSKTLLVYMHPASMMHRLPLPSALVREGAHILLAGSRYNRNDSPLILENVVRDYAAYVRHAREHWKYERIVVAGWSGGGSLTAFYQAQAERPSLTLSAAGEPVDFSGLPAGDAMMFHAAHLSRATVLRDTIDPSVLDEADPDIRDPELDLYDPRNPNKPPYGEDYIRYFRGAQYARMRRKTAWVKETLHDLRKRGGKETERAFVTHRTLAEPRFLDATLDPNDRRIGWSFLGEPEAANTIPAGLARFSTLRGWLSQWSFDDTKAHALSHAPGISVPLLVMENSADEAVPQPHARMFFDAAGSRDKTFELIRGATHYYAEQPELLQQVVDLILTWLKDRGLHD